MQDYSHYDIKDFLADEAFCRWAIHQKPADDIFWENWLRNNPDRRAIVASARELITQIHKAQDYLQEEELQQELDRLTSARKSATQDQVSAPAANKYMSATRLFMFFSLCIVAFAGYNWYADLEDRFSGQANRAHAGHERWIEVYNDSKEIKSIVLQDSSKVKLFAYSRISYPADFVKNEREVLLNGEAFFEVTKNPESPFKVYTRDVVTTVLGTSFTVKAFDKEKDVRVVVRTGKVTVSAGSQPNKAQPSETSDLVLLPNQQVVYNRGEQKMKRSLVENPVPVVHAEAVNQNLIFESAPVTKVFDALQKIYEVQIVYDGSLLAGCQLTADLGQEPLFEKLTMICTAIQARYELIDGQIVIYGTSCK